jgi:hypothetical protein
MEAIETRVEFLDNHGSRGVERLQVQLTELVKDVAKIETRTGVRQTLVYLAAFLPIYVLLFLQMGMHP